jgi:hypothetical protein
MAAAMDYRVPGSASLVCQVAKGSFHLLAQLPREATSPFASFWPVNAYAAIAKIR